MALRFFLKKTLSEHVFDHAFLCLFCFSFVCLFVLVDWLGFLLVLNMTWVILSFHF